MNHEGEEPDFAESPPPQAPSAPERPDIIIRDLTGRRTCSVCRKEKAPYIEIEVDGVVESTCRECYEGRIVEEQVIEVTSCRTCGAAVEVADRFCGRCGALRVVACPACGTAVAEEDRFCGKCGSKLTPSPS